MAKSYYDILGISKNASPEEIKRAYRELVQKYHPDKFYGKPEYQQMNEKFKEINEAYQVLSDSEKRQMYDQYGSSFEQARARGGAGGFEGFRDWAAYAEAMKQNGNGFGFSAQGGPASGWNFGDMGDFGDLGDILGDMFGFGSGTRTRARRTNRGKDLRYEMGITFREAAFGAEKEIVLEKYNICRVCGGNGVAPDSKFKTCPTCRGSGRVIQRQRTFFGDFQTESVCPTCGGQGKIPEKKCPNCKGEGRIKEKVNLKIKIPAGINGGQTIRYTGQGEAGKNGATGDLYISFHIKPDPEFKRDHYDVLAEKEISISEAVLGASISIKTLEGEVSLKIPAGTKSGQVFKLKGRGITNLSGRGKGDHLVTIIVKIPKNLSKKQKELLEKLRNEGL